MDQMKRDYSMGQHFFHADNRVFNPLEKEELANNGKLGLLQTTKQSGAADARSSGCSRLGMSLTKKANGLLDLGMLNSGPSRHVALGHGHGKTVPSAFGYEAALKVGQCGKDVEDQ